MRIRRRRTVDLPLYNPSEPILNPGRGEHLHLPSYQTTFLRNIRIWGNAFIDRTLSESLQIADESFEEAAEASGAKVPWHQWGLQELRGTRLPYQEHPGLIPEGYRLVAEVAVVDQETIYAHKDTHAQIIQGLGNYILSGSSQAVWEDADTTQFVSGTDRYLGRTGLWLVDIEPAMFARTAEATANHLHVFHRYNRG